jgi:hypothetical protein
LRGGVSCNRKNSSYGKLSFEYPGASILDVEVGMTLSARASVEASSPVVAKVFLPKRPQPTQRQRLQ